jgi:membrane fusion protein (multidrug efflux system)
MNSFTAKADIRIELADHSIYPGTAKVAIISPTIDENTNTIKIWGIFENADAELLPGSYVTVLLRPRNAGKTVGVLPSALQVDKSGSYVYVMKKDGIAEKRRVVPGNVNGDILEIKSGLETGENVVVDGMHKILPNLRLKTVPYKK